MSYPDKYILSYQKLVMWEYVEVLTKTFRKKNCKIHASTISFWPKRPGHCWPDFGSKRHFYVVLCCVVLCCVVLCCAVLWCGVVKETPTVFGVWARSSPGRTFFVFFYKSRQLRNKYIATSKSCIFECRNWQCVWLLSGSLRVRAFSGVSFCIFRKQPKRAYKKWVTSRIWTRELPGCNRLFYHCANSTYDVEMWDLHHISLLSSTNKKRISHAGIRTRVLPVRAAYPDQLDLLHFWSYVVNIKNMIVSGTGKDNSRAKRAWTSNLRLSKRCSTTKLNRPHRLPFTQWLNNRTTNSPI
jgi:hypothetical protein